MFACAFVRTKLLFVIGLKSLSITILLEPISTLIIDVAHWYGLLSLVCSI